MGAFLEKYGIAIFVLVIIGIMVLMASGVGVTIEDLVEKEVKQFTQVADDEIENALEKDSEEDVENNTSIYNKKYFITSGSGQYIIVDTDNTISLFDKFGNVTAQIPSFCVLIENNMLTISNVEGFNGVYKISKHEILVENIADIPKGYQVLVEDGYCNHITALNGNGGTWIEVEVDGNGKPLLLCNTCNQQAFNYELIDGVLYTRDIQIGDNYSCVDSEYNPKLFGGYNALIWDKTLDEIKIKKEINGIEVKRFWGHQKYTDETDLISRNWTFNGTMDEWQNIENEWLDYDIIYPNLKVTCTDGVIEY